MFEIGNSLREARLRQGLDFPELEQATKIRAKYLRALEEEQFDSLPGQTYVKGFLRGYADSLGLDGQLYVDEYNSRYVTNEDEPPLRARRSTVQVRNPRLESRVVVAALVAIAVVTALVIAAWRFGGPDEARNTIPNLGRAPIQPRVKKPRPRPPERRATRAPARPAPARLLLTAARGNCWIEVHAGSPNGELLYEGTLELGQSQRFVRRRLWINVGAPANLAVTLNGRRITRPVPGILVATAKGIFPAQSQA